MSSCRNNVHGGIVRSVQEPIQHPPILQEARVNNIGEPMINLRYPMGEKLDGTDNACLSHQTYLVTRMISEDLTF